MPRWQTERPDRASDWPVHSLATLSPYSDMRRHWKLDTDFSTRSSLGLAKVPALTWLKDARTYSSPRSPGKSVNRT